MSPSPCAMAGSWNVLPFSSNNPSTELFFMIPFFLLFDFFFPLALRLPITVTNPTLLRDRQDIFLSWSAPFSPFPAHICLLEFHPFINTQTGSWKVISRFSSGDFRGGTPSDPPTPPQASLYTWEMGHSCEVERAIVLSVKYLLLDTQWR